MTRVTGDLAGTVRGSRRTFEPRYLAPRGTNGPMTGSRPTIGRAYAFTGLGLAILGAFGTAVVRIAAPVPIHGAFGFNDVAMLGYLIAGLTWASIGALLVTRRPENSIGWLMVLVGVGYSLSQCTVSLTLAFAAEGSDEGDRLAQVAGWTTVPPATGRDLPNHDRLPVSDGSSPEPSMGPVHARRVVAGNRLRRDQPHSAGSPAAHSQGVQNPFGIGPDLRDGRPIALGSSSSPC